MAENTEGIPVVEENPGKVEDAGPAVGEEILKRTMEGAGPSGGGGGGGGNMKRKAEDAATISQDPDCTKRLRNEGGQLTPQVAQHYNRLEEKGLAVRSQSRIFHLRNFNNWIKSMLIADTLRRLRSDSPGSRLCVLDLGVGKGGDLLKWKKGGIDHLVCADLAETSVQQCEERYRSMAGRGGRGPRIFTAEFIAADCAKEDLSRRYHDPNTTFDLVSCQFVLHYSFESHAQADRMLRNAGERLRPGGFFIGTTPDGYELVRRLKASEGLSFGNSIYSITFGQKDEFPLFGCQYNFHLEGVVDCPEFLVYFPLLEKMAEKYGLRLVYKQTFAEFFEQQVTRGEGRSLLERMKALETYPPHEGQELASSDPGDYAHARARLEELKSKGEGGDRGTPEHPRVGTLSLAEWEATSVYLVYCFQKVAESKDDSSANRPQPPETSQTSQ
ncbi:RNMT [Branchiostoma lanceolatum]|uniref:mRNA cap guanine-N(7) methyltransferase n=1 Tax=Branchiostoma lanceolatum TaxID=7740 RepID=A0A8K0A9S0_BRALA|nr:RNMT [Branchiostoma lanceolatum]